MATALQPLSAPGAASRCPSGRLAPFWPSGPLAGGLLARRGSGRPPAWAAGAAVACGPLRAAARQQSPAPADLASGPPLYELLEETVDGQVSLEQPGAIPAGHFQAHGDAVDLCDQLEQLNTSMASVLSQSESVMEISAWDGFTLPEATQKEFTQVYRSNRKEAERQKKEERRLKRALRQAGQPAAPAAAEAPAATEPEPQQQMDSAERAARRASRRQQRETAGAASAGSQQPVAEQLPPPAAAAQPAPVAQPQQVQQPPAAAVARQPLPQQQQAGLRQRRSRRSTAAAINAAAVAAAPAPTASPPGLVADGAGEPATSNRGGVAGPRPAAPMADKQPPVTMAAAAAAARPKPAVPAAAIVPQGSAGASSSSSRSAGPSALGFVPLVLEHQSAAAAAGRAPAAGSRRVARASGLVSSGVSGRGTASTAAWQSTPAALATASALQSGSGRARVAGGERVPAAAAATALASVSGGLTPSSAGRLADNNIYGLDMRAELLSAEQEKELAAMVQDLLQLEAAAAGLAAELGRAPTDLEWMEAAGCAPAPGDDACDAVRGFQNRLHHARAAKQVMISSNYKLVVAICRKYQGYGMAMGDLINEGIAGLVKGVERFEPAKGCKFSTYAHWWIRQAVTRSLSEQGRLVRLPSHLQEMLTKMTRISRTFEAQYGREATLEELARELGVEPSKISDAYEAVFTPRSLDQPLGDGEGATLGDVIEDERMLDAEDAAYLDSLKHDLESVLAHLPPREAGVLRMRFGLVDGTEHTLDEIGAQYNVTRERIRQIEAKAIRQLRARQLQPGSVIADYQTGDMDGGKQMAARTSSGTRKQS